ncbi:MAG: hypothetical protein ABIR11_12570 [Candidatus Limnocylindrales bacterium]
MGGPGASGRATPADEPTLTDEPSGVALTPDPSPPPPTAPGAPASSPTPADIAAACSGSTANREFYVSVALAVEWPVLCAVLPKGWFVATGSYRLAGGGKLAISYTGPNGVSLSLAEGAFCADATACVPAGTGAGSAALGPLGGTLVRLQGGAFAVVAARGANLSWLLVADGLDETMTRALAAALTEVAD